MPYREASQLISYITFLKQKLLNFADSYSSLEYSKLLPAKIQQELSFYFIGRQQTKLFCIRQCVPMPAPTERGKHLCAKTRYH